MLTNSVVSCWPTAGSGKSRPHLLTEWVLHIRRVSMPETPPFDVDRVRQVVFEGLRAAERSLTQLQPAEPERARPIDLCVLRKAIVSSAVSCQTPPLQRRIPPSEPRQQPSKLNAVAFPGEKPPLPRS